MYKDENPRQQAHGDVDTCDEKTKEVESQVITGNEAFAQALLKEPPKPLTPVAIQLYAACLIGFLSSSMNGYDGSLINNLLANKAFLDYYHGSNSGIWTGIVTSMYQIGCVAAFPFAGPAVDTWGRRFGLVIGSLCIIIGTVIQGTSTGVHSFIGGLFLLGFGVSISSTAGPTYIVEVSHPAYRGTVAAVYHAFWLAGSIIASGAARGADDVGGNASWRIVIWLQLLFSGLITIFALILPESPRWLYVNNKQTKAKEMMTKYHGEGNPNSEWVKLQLNEYEEYLEMNGADKRWWDYRALFRNRASIYRLYCNCCISVFSQWMGNAVLTYFMSSVLDIVGYTGTIAQHNIILINNCQQFAWAILGSTLVDKFGRRPLLLFSNIGCCLIWLGMTIATYEFARSEDDVQYGGSNRAAAQGALAMIFVFGAVYCVGITPLQALYPVEVLNFEMRAKGMAFSNLSAGAAGLLNQFAWSVSMERIGWRTYIIFTIWDAVQAIVIYFTIVETKNRTLEELDDIFNAPNPVKSSIEKKRIVVNVRGDILN